MWQDGRSKSQIPPLSQQMLYLENLVATSLFEHVQLNDSLCRQGIKINSGWCRTLSYKMHYAAYIPFILGQYATFCHWLSFITLTRASLQSDACSELRGLVTLSLLVMKERWVKLVASADLLTYGKHSPSFNAEGSSNLSSITSCAHNHKTLAQRRKCSPPVVTLQCWSAPTC